MSNEIYVYAYACSKCIKNVMKKTKTDCFILIENL